MDVFLEDNLKKELSMVYRANVEDELSRCGPRYTTSILVFKTVLERQDIDSSMVESPL